MQEHNVQERLARHHIYSKKFFIQTPKINIVDEIRTMVQVWSQASHVRLLRRR